MRILPPKIAIHGNNIFTCINICFHDSPVGSKTSWGFARVSAILTAGLR